MSQSLSKVILHIVFSTKDRIDQIKPKQFQLDLYKYISTVIREMNSNAYRIGGIENHIHIACSLPRTISQSDFIKKIKGASSSWVTTRNRLGNNNNKGNKNILNWQKGFGVFSISESHLPRLLKYIDNQEQHHKKENYKDEFRNLLEKYEIEYDELWVWD